MKILFHGKCWKNEITCSDIISAFQLSVAFHVGPNHLIDSPDQMTDYPIECNNKLNWFIC